MTHTRHIWLLALILIMIGLLLQGCTAPPTQPLMITTALPLPVRPALPAIKSNEMTCLADDVYARIAARDRMRRHYAEQLEVIIKSTHRPREPSTAAGDSEPP